MLLPKPFLNVDAVVQSPSNKMICLARISKIENDLIVLRANNLPLPLVRFMSFVKLTIKHPTAGYKVILAQINFSSAAEIHACKLSLLADDEKRGYFRVDMDAPTHIYFTDDIDLIREQKFNKKANLVRNCFGVIKNISLSGILLECEDVIEIGEVLTVEIRTRRGVELFPISIKRRILPSEEDHRQFYECGCSFEEANDTKMDNLCSAILEKQSEIIQKMKR